MHDVQFDTRKFTEILHQDISLLHPWFDTAEFAFLTGFIKKKDQNKDQNDFCFNRNSLTQVLLKSQNNSTKYGIYLQLSHL